MSNASFPYLILRLTIQILPNGMAGFDAWLANGGGDYIAPEFSTHNAGPGIPDGHWQGTEDNYTTAVVGNLSMCVRAQSKVDCICIYLSAVKCTE